VVSTKSTVLWDVMPCSLIRFVEVWEACIALKIEGICYSQNLVNYTGLHGITP
jgi:hypothetical protein